MKLKNFFTVSFISGIIVLSAGFICLRIDKVNNTKTIECLSLLINDSSKRIENLEKQQKDFLKIFDAVQIDAKHFNTSVAEISNILTKSLKDQIDSSKRIENLEKQQKDFLKIFDAVQIDAKHFNTSVAEISNTLTKSLKDQISGNQIAADTAIKLAEDASKEKNFDLAEVYCLSAINHKPSEIKYLVAYSSIILNNIKPLTIERLQRLSDILDLSIYQVAPEAISEVLDIKEKIEVAQKDLLSADVSITPEINRDSFLIDYKNVIEGKLSISAIARGNEISKHLKERLLELNELISNPLAENEEILNLNSELERTNSIYEAQLALDSANVILKKAESINLNSTLDDARIVQSQINAANSLLSQVWSTDTTSIPALDKEAKEAMLRILKLEQTTNKILSKPALVDAEKILEEIHSIYKNSFKTYAQRIKEINELSKKMSSFASKIQDREMYDSLEDSSVNIANMLKELEKERYLAYQKWALDNLENARVQLDRDSGADNAWKVFENCLKEINVSLLLSDVNSLYTAIYSDCATKSKKGTEMMFAKASVTKFKSLDDF